LKLKTGKHPLHTKPLSKPNEKSAEAKGSQGLKDSTVIGPQQGPRKLKADKAKLDAVIGALRHGNFALLKTGLTIMKQ
jgi:hypothetical protein